MILVKEMAVFEFLCIASEKMDPISYSLNDDELPLVSCIMIFYNANKSDFFDTAIKSVIDQTYRNIELLLIDDGSSDGSEAVAKSYSETHSSIQYIQHENQLNHGMSASRNLGLASASGKYVAYLDADDYWFPEKISAQVSILKQMPGVGMVFGRPIYWHEWAGPAGSGEKDYVDELSVAADQTYSSPYLLLHTHPLQYHASAPCPSDVLVRRSVLENIGGSVDEFKGYYEDCVLFSKIYLHTNVFVSSDSWLKYRLHPDSCCAVVERSEDVSRYRKNYLIWLRGYIKTHKISGYKVRYVISLGIVKAKYPRFSRISKKILSIAKKCIEPLRRVA